MITKTNGGRIVSLKWDNQLKKDNTGVHGTATVRLTSASGHAVDVSTSIAPVSDEQIAKTRALNEAVKLIDEWRADLLRELGKVAPASDRLQQPR